MNNEYGYYVNLLGSLNKLIMVVYLLTLLKIKKKKRLSYVRCWLVI